MVKHASDLDLLFHALAAAPRRVILEEMSEEGSSVTEIAGLFEMSLPAVSKHLRVLERAGLVTRTREGRVHRMHRRAEGLEDATTWIEQHRAAWEDRFDALARVVEAPRRGRRKKPKGRSR